MLLVKLFSKLPFWFIHGLSDFLAWLLHTVIKYRRQVIYDNLRHGFPDKTEAWYKATIYAFYRSFTDTWLEAVKSIDFSEAEMRQRVKVQNPELLIPYDNKEQSTMGLASHSANWEWLLLRGALDVRNVWAVYLRVNSPTFEKLMLLIRNRFGIRLVEKADLLRDVVRSRGQFRNFAIIADQAPIDGINRHWESFMNRPAPFFTAAEKMAKKEGMPLYYVGIKRTSRGRYTIWYELLGEPPYAQLPEGELTSRYIKALENNIRLQPELYLWSHKRWKHRLPEGEAVYSPM